MSTAENREELTGVELGDEADSYHSMRALLVAAGYRDVDHRTLRPGQRIRHRGEQYPEAYDNGTAVVVAVMEHSGSAWSQKYGDPDVEVIVLRDKPLFEGLGRLAQLANYHVRAVQS